MEGGQTLTIVVTILVPLVAFLGFIYKELKEWRKETREETNQIRQEINQIRIESLEQTKRTDRLYEMFIDLLKSQNPKTTP